LFPVNQFNPRGDGRAVDIREEIRSGAQTPQEDLLSGDIDYDRVFKSRPRIATSPIFSPEKFPQSDSGADEDFYDEEVTGIDLDDVDQTDDEALRYWLWSMIMIKDSILAPFPASVVITPYGVSHACTFQFGLVLRENCNICWTRYIYIHVAQIFIPNISHSCLPMNIQ
jgi:hypothetical protein